VIWQNSTEWRRCTVVWHSLAEWRRCTVVWHNSVEWRKCMVIWQSSAKWRRCTVFNLLGDGGTTINSGSIFIYWVPVAYDPILSTFKQALLSQYPVVTIATQEQLQTFDLCFNILGMENQEYPSFSILFRNDVSFFPPPQNYLVEVALNVKCLAMQGLQSI